MLVVAGCITIATERFRPTARLIPRNVASLNPGLAATIAYVAGLKFESEKVPASPEVTLRSAPVFSFRTWIVAPGMIAPLVSVTLPLMRP